MAKLQIPLNGSNYTSAQRKRAFQEALADGRKIRTRPAEYLQTCSGNGSRMSSLQPSVLPSKPDRQNDAQLEIIQQGVQHAVDHQRRTVDIHQQYLSQLREFQGIFQGLLDQQAAVLENGSGAASSASLEVIQNSLAGFHRLQEKELEVHQQFLHHQAQYSNAFVTLLTEQYQQLDNRKLSPGSFSSYPPSSNLETPQSSSAADQLDEQPLQPGQSPQPEIQSSVRSSPHMTPSPDLQSAFHPEEINTSLLEIVAEKTGYPAEMLDLSMDMEADLGIDSIKRVEILGALEDRYPELPPADTDILAETRTLEDILVYLKTPQNMRDTDAPTDLETPPAETPMPDAFSGPEEVDPQKEEAFTDNLDLTAFLLETVAEKTGYPVEMLETSMDMEADLGIDSIKRVEILGAVEDQVPDLPPVDGDILGEMRTLDEIITLMTERSRQQPAEVKKKASELMVNPVQLRDLPRPDWLELEINPVHPLLVTDEGSDFTIQFAEALQNAGWPLLLVQTPDRREEPRELPADLPRLRIDSENPDDIQQQLSKDAERVGNFAGIIHLHPLAFSQTRDRSIIKQTFFLAKFLAQLFKETENQDPARKYFLTITQLDGKLGTSTAGTFQEGGGLSGLVKTFYREVPDVFCRYIDLDPSLSAEEKAALVIRELHDPRRDLQEVGLSKQSRVTLTLEKE